LFRGGENLTEQVDEVYLQKKIQAVRRKEKSVKVTFVLAPILIIIGWAMYNYKIYHYFLGTVWVEYPFRPLGLVPIILGILTIPVGILELSYYRRQKKKYMEQLRQLQLIKCPKCGKELFQKFPYCPSCGNPLK